MAIIQRRDVWTKATSTACHENRTDYGSNDCEMVSLAIKMCLAQGNKYWESIKIELTTVVMIAR